jgi:hypothetical protein
MRKSFDSYHPRKSGFPYKLLKYLYKYGLSAGVDAQEGIGLNAWAKAKGDIYANRASSYFNNTISQLESRGLAKVIPGDYYELTPEGEEFIENYKIR